MLGPSSGSYPPGRSRRPSTRLTPRKMRNQCSPVTPKQGLPVSGARHRRNGDRIERTVVRALRDRGLAAERVPGRFSGDVSDWHALAGALTESPRAQAQRPRRLMAIVPTAPGASCASSACSTTVPASTSLSTTLSAGAAQQQNNDLRARNLCAGDGARTR
jgi:hypothetical protein